MNKIAKTLRIPTSKFSFKAIRILFTALRRSGKFSETINQEFPMLFKLHAVIMTTMLLLVCPISAQAPLIVGIVGGSGSGKTTFAKKITEFFGENATLIDQDSYYKDISHLSLEERNQVNFDHPDSLDFSMLCSHLRELKNGKSILKPLYDFKTHSRTSSVEEIHAAKIIVVEGILLFAHAEVRELCDIKLFIETDDDIRLLRRLERDVTERGRSIEQIKKQYLTTVKPMYSLFVAPSKAHADIIIPSMGNTAEAERIITSRLMH